MFDAYAVIKKVDEIKACEIEINNFIKLKDEYNVISIKVQHKKTFSVQMVEVNGHSKDELDNFINNEITYYTNQLAKLKQELKDL